MKTFLGANCLVSGGAGFIGSTLVGSLLEMGAKVKVIDNLETGKKSNLEDYLNHIEFARIDIRNLDEVREAVKKVDYVLHLAAVSSVPRSLLQPDLTFTSNVMGTLNILIASKEHGVKKVLNVSSSSVYGGIKEEFKKETMPVNPLSPYATSKVAAELISRSYFQAFHLNTVTLRYFNVFGPRQDPNSPYAAVIPKFLNALLNKQPPVVFGDGSQARDFTFVDDVVNATLLALERGKDGEVYNAGGGTLTTLNELLEHLYELTGSRISPVYTEWRQGDVFRSGADISKAKKDLEYEAKVGLREGLKRTMDWFARR